MPVVPDHLLLNAFRFRAALQKIHRRLQGNLGSLNKAGEKHLLCHGAGHFCPIRVKLTVLSDCLLTEPLTR